MVVLTETCIDIASTYMAQLIDIKYVTFGFIRFHIVFTLLAVHFEQRQGHQATDSAVCLWLLEFRSTIS